MSAFRAGVAAAVLAVTATGAGAASVTSTSNHDSVRDTVIRQAVGGQRPVWVRGAPPDGADAAAVAAALRTPAFAQSTTFVPAEDAAGGPTLVLVFGARGAGGNVCRDGGQPAGVRALVVTAVLCVNRDPVRIATLRGDSAGPSDPAFADEMAELTAALYRRNRRTRFND